MTNKTSSIKWRTILGLLMIYLAVFMNLYWIWGILFLYWVIPDIFSGTTYFMEAINKEENPILYWMIIVSWLLVGVYYLVFSFFPEWQNY